MKLKQLHIDNGWLGGIYTTFTASLGILSLFTFVGVLTLNYDRYLKLWLNPIEFIIIAFVLIFIYELSYFMILVPSAIRFNNRQSWIHGNPFKDELYITNEKLDIVIEKLNNLSNKKATICSENICSDCQDCTKTRDDIIDCYWDLVGDIDEEDI